LKRIVLLIIFAVPLLALLVRAQFVGGGAEQPIFSNTTTGPNTELNGVPGVYLRWVASDLSNSPVTAWPDRIESRYLVQATVADQPAWATNAVIFDSASADFMTLTNTVFLRMGTALGAPTNAMLVVCSSDAIGAPSRSLIDKNDTSGDAFLWHGFSSVWRAPSIIGVETAIGKNYEYLWAGTNGALMLHFTNGIAALQTDQQNSAIFQFLGRRSNATFPWHGTVKEIVIFTNSGSQPFFTTPQIDAIHQYVTNTYNPSTF